MSDDDDIKGHWHTYVIFSGPGFVRAEIDGELAYWEGDIAPDDDEDD